MSCHFLKGRSKLGFCLILPKFEHWFAHCHMGAACLMMAYCDGESKLPSPKLACDTFIFYRCRGDSIRAIHPNTCRNLATVAKQKARSSRADLPGWVQDEPTRQQPRWKRGQRKWRPWRSSFGVSQYSHRSNEPWDKAAVRIHERHLHQESLPGRERWVLFCLHVYFFISHPTTKSVVWRAEGEVFLQLQVAASHFDLCFYCMQLNFFANV